ncbi:hypothetical protein CI1B_29810 [Bradyrhizobium ivorense]|uniref:Uncharacterized protein n=1 Tax=Bradyrhizobium ivorense TaxID=2511166 RepID=A0A508TB99_9BRAD|nr:hypothetical protein [Bradyrhizobium ivorense]VIO69748.1 hypothetical protein CI41S_19950 [Bradyrhizobium ivorense]VIO70158.1 hypothetical protein CI1B_29810 [Bradyrhizobium ivorense]
MAKALFWGTLLFVLIIGGLSYFYTQALNQLQADSEKIAQIRTDYETRLHELQKNLMVEQTKTVAVPTQTVTTECRSPNINFGGIKLPPVCTPVVKTTTQNVQQVVKVEDAKVRAELDETLARLKGLSNQNQNAKSVLDEFRPWYEFAQQLMKPVISITVLVVSLIIILSKRYNADQEKWAFGSLGTIIGVWLK